MPENIYLNLPIALKLVSLAVNTCLIGIKSILTRKCTCCYKMMCAVIKQLCEVQYSNSGQLIFMTVDPLITLIYFMGLKDRYK